MITPSACPDCLRRSHLLSLLGPYLENAHGADRDRGLFRLLTLTDRELATEATPKLAEHLLGRVKALSEQRLRELLREADCWALCHHSDFYPESLRDLDAPPNALFGRGHPAALADLRQQGAAAVLGAERATSYGREVARTLGRDLAAAGVTVVGGMSFGIEGCAHRGGLEAGRSMAVLPGGPDTAYPAPHRSLWRRLLEQGAVLSELPPGSSPWRWTFRARNRILAGLACGTVVVEATEDSEALQAARVAADLGRALGAVPGPITSPASLGPNRLLANGAQVILEAADLLGAGFGKEAGQ